MDLKSKLEAIRKTITRTHLGEFAAIVPEHYWPTFTCVGGAADHVYVVNRLIGPITRPLKVLVVGIFGGRDFWAMRVAGHEVTGFDLDEVADCPPTIRGDAEEIWPFPDQAFDVIIIGEVLEHLILDWWALREARRTLRADGLLLGTVPFLHDSEHSHVRIHSPISIQRLLNVSGFAVEDFVYRPGLINISVFNYVNHLFAVFYYFLTKSSLYRSLIPLYGRIEWGLGHQGWIPRRFLKVLGLINWGVTFKARPTLDVLEYKEINYQTFIGSKVDNCQAKRRCHQYSV